MSSIKAGTIAFANAALRHVDAVILRRSSVHVASHTDILARVRELGLQPKTAIDVGAATGEWTIACHDAFPDVRHVFVEPLREFARSLEALERRLPGSAFVRAAAAEHVGSAELNVHVDLVGSSLLREAEGPATDGEPRMVPTVSIDDVAKELSLKPPFVIKVDTQGAELRVLDGAQRSLRSAELVLLETSLIPFFEGGPILGDVLNYMRARGFELYDVFGPTYRLLDGALAQVDLAFIPEESSLRKDFRLQHQSSGGSRTNDSEQVSDECPTFPSTRPTKRKQAPTSRYRRFVMFSGHRSNGQSR